MFFRPDFLAGSQIRFDRLAAEIAWDERIRARRMASFGVPSSDSGTVWPGAPMPRSLVPIAASVGYEPNNRLANVYADGGSTMSDRSVSVAEPERGTGISIVSLGAARVI